MNYISKAIEELKEGKDYVTIEVNGKEKEVHRNYIKVLDQKGVKYKVIGSWEKENRTYPAIKCRRCGKMNTSEKDHCRCYD